VRAFVQHRLHGQSLPQKLWYAQPMFRYERPQAGRGRQFHQFGAEAIGSLDPACDVEMIAIPLEIYRRLGIGRFELLVNSIGCDACRPSYRSELKAYLSDRFDRLCATCKSRYERNPLRVLDCKEESCRQETADAPSAIDHLCDECGRHFARVREMLEAMEITYRVDTRLVRGLDYYTKTVFEIVTDVLGAQGTLAAGGRYDGLTAEVGGGDFPAVGFAGGMERAVLALRASGQGVDESVESPELFLVCLGQSARLAGVKIAHELRAGDIITALDYHDDFDEARSMRAQMKAAGRSGAPFALILGDDELARGVAALKRMSDGEQREVPLNALVESVREQLGGGGGLA
jgi:histidyl-tRNA synthetase